MNQETSEIFESFTAPGLTDGFGNTPVRSPPAAQFVGNRAGSRTPTVMFAALSPVNPRPLPAKTFDALLKASEFGYVPPIAAAAIVPVRLAASR